MKRWSLYSIKIFTHKSYRDREKCVSQQGCVVLVETRERGGTENKLIQSARVLISRHYNSLLLVPASLYGAAKQLNVLQSHGQHGGLRWMELPNWPAFSAAAKSCRHNKVRPWSCCCDPQKQQEPRWFRPVLGWINQGFLFKLQLLHPPPIFFCWFFCHRFFFITLYCLSLLL